MATFVTRAQWGARPPRSTSGNITPQNGGVTVHHVGGSKVAASSHSSCAGQVRGHQNHHMDGNGWSDIAYSHLVCVHGYVFEGRGENVRTAANGTTSGNQNWYAVCGLVGGSSSNYDSITSGLIDAFHHAITRLRNQGGAAGAVNGHQDHKATACPGNLYPLVLDGTLNPGGGGGTPSWPGVYFTQPPIFNHPSVATWQSKMNSAHGFSLGVDSQYGPASESACRTLQGRKGLTVDGVVGPDTWNATFS
ncbi:peptidoglycan-binding domain-containing protein [Streptomyces sp. RKND-216]|uniref:peptidoglycan-binding domain-containing protein n=1 Tax=Streptomyces sp. RKND-216 TaxID=2562581 RepID=UPI00109E122A|nr:peptidoglycan-binding domain-containing protein [Streptomyces sp. RKND-216]THA25919.1 peptidoglycan-binding domain-containing protein [Streptomyces sp. RKND-216]